MMTGHRKILIVSDPGQGILNPSFRFANRLLKMGVDVTFSSSYSGIQRIDKETTPQGLTFAPFSDGHENGNQPNAAPEQIISDFATNGTSAIAEIMSRAAAAGQPFDHLVYTTVLPWAATVATAHNVKSTLLWCQPATLLVIYYYYFHGYESLFPGIGNNSTFPISLPGLPPLTMPDLPSFLLPSRPNDHDFLIQVMIDHFDVLKTAPRILVNTFNELEIESITAVDKLEFLPIGPLIPLDKVEDDCILWLNTKPKSSVVYVSFGTLASLSMDQMEEIATGLVECGRPFVWVIRDSAQARRLSKIKELQKLGMIVDWCSQVAVLRHEAIGCFVMHGGWNSTTEALISGVPMVVFPQWSDQGTNAKMIEDVWKTGVRVKKRGVDGMVEGNEIQRCVEIVMAGGENCEMRRDAEKWRDLAREALNNSGSSTLNLQAFLNNII